MQEFRDIKIHKLDSAASEERFLLEYGDNMFEANAIVVDLLETLQDHGSRQDAVDTFVEKHKQKYTAEHVNECIDMVFNPIFEKEANNASRGFLYSKQFIDGQEISRLTDALKCLFRMRYTLPVTVAAVAMDIWFLLSATGMRRFDGGLTVTILVGLVLFLCASSFFHELGHASACRYMGIKHGGIGFAMYLTFPIFFTDVTKAWCLPRKKRMVINLGGIYFQLYILIGLIAVYYFTNSDFVRYLILAMNLGFVLVLNPFFRFDGYWIATDLLGVPNLRQQSMSTLRYTLARLMGRKTSEKPYLLLMRGREKWIFVIYSVVVNLFMGYFFFYVIPLFIYHFCSTFPLEAEKLLTYLSSGVTPPFAIIHNIFGQLLFLAMIGYMLYGLSRPYINRIRRNPNK